MTALCVFFGCNQDYMILFFKKYVYHKKYEVRKSTRRYRLCALCVVETCPKCKLTIHSTLQIQTWNFSENSYPPCMVNRANLR